MSQGTEPTEEKPSPKQTPSTRAVVVKIGTWLLVLLVLSISVRREHWNCPVCHSTKETVSWRILVFLPLSEREENVQEKPAQEHAHNWHRNAYTERNLLGVIFKGHP